MQFEIHAERSAVDKKVFIYDNLTNVLKDSDGKEFKFTDKFEHQDKIAHPFSKDKPLRKVKAIKHLKIQLGLGCNYSCEYCSQKFVERADSTTSKDIEAFMKKLEVLEFDEALGLRVELWGGEPLVYWKTLKPLAEAIKEKFEHWQTPPKFSMITNGSILNDEMIDWLMMMDFSVSISHDGGGQSIRGLDPFDDPVQRERLLGFYRAMTRLKKGISFNSMLNAKNMSRKEISEWFVELTGDPDISLGEGTLVDAYDADGIESSLQTLQQHFEFRRTAFADIYSTGGQINFKMILNKVNQFITDVLSQKSADLLGQKCGMDDDNVLAVDLHGNVLTCQNVSAVEVSKNGESHLGGTLDDYENVAITTSTHWSEREECPKCPVVHICKGACMFLDKEFWDVSCANAYSDNVALFALAIERMTGYIPTLIKQDELPLERQDIFGSIYEHQEKPKKKLFPIKVVSEIAQSIDGVEIYGKAQTV